MRKTLLLLPVLFLTACSDGCGNTVVARQDAPDGRHSAVLFERNCGATTPFATHISILRKGERLSGAGNVYIADADHGAAATGAWGGPWADIAWRSPSILTVRYVRNARIFRQETRADDVQVDYQPGRP